MHCIGKYLFGDRYCRRCMAVGLVQWCQCRKVRGAPLFSYVCCICNVDIFVTEPCTRRVRHLLFLLLDLPRPNFVHVPRIMLTHCLPPHRRVVSMAHRSPRDVIRGGDTLQSPIPRLRLP